MHIRLPYGRTHLEGELPDVRVRAILQTAPMPAVPQERQTEIVRLAMENPEAGSRLRELAKGKSKVVIIASDHTRPVPSRIIMPLMLREIREGNPDARIEILIATGCHRNMTREELIAKFGEEIVQRERILVHDCDDEAQLVEIGTLPSGGELRIHRRAWEADLLVAEGFIEPHFFAGFSGGPKSVLPGIASRKCVMYNHNSRFIGDPRSRLGMLEGNPIHRDMEYAAQRARLAYIVNVVLNEKKEIIHAVAGDCMPAHRAGCDFLRKRCQFRAPQVDIAITTNGGYPLDQNVYQAVKGMASAEPIVRPGGVIIMAAKAEDGHGGEHFYRTFRDEVDNQKLMARFLRTPMDETIVDQWQSQILARILLQSSVVMISDMPDALIRDFHMIPAHSIEEAVQIADSLLGNSCGSIAVIPDGVSVIAHLDTPQSQTSPI